MFLMFLRTLQRYLDCYYFKAHGLIQFIVVSINIGCNKTFVERNI